MSEWLTELTELARLWVVNRPAVKRNRLNVLILWAHGKFAHQKNVKMNYIKWYLHWIRIANKIFTMQSQFESASIRRIYRGLWDHFGIYSSRLWHITPLDSSTAQQVYQNIMYSWETNCVFFCRLFHTHRAKHKYNDAMQQSDVCMFSILITDEWQSRELPSVFLALVHIMIGFLLLYVILCAQTLCMLFDSR